MKKTSNIKKNLKATVTTVTTAGILLTSITPSFAAEQKENTGEQIAPIQTSDELREKDSNFQINARTTAYSSARVDNSLTDQFTLQGNAELSQKFNNRVMLNWGVANGLGAMTKKELLDLNKDFSITGHVSLGRYPDGKEGVAMAFHTGKIGSLGKGGGGLGVLGLPNGVAFEMDAHTGAQEDNDPSFNHNQIKTPHAGFVSTSKSNNSLVALAPMQTIQPHDTNLESITMNWDAADKKLTVDYLGKHWELINPPFDYTQKYNFIIASTTGVQSNQTEFEIGRMTIRSKKPTVNELTDRDTKVTGKATAGSKITVKAGANELGTSQADQNGTYSVTIPKQPVGTKLAVTASNSAGTSQEVGITVKETAPEVNEVIEKVEGIFTDNKFDTIKDTTNQKAIDEAKAAVT
ncbi:lectin-like domain-containing protein, partial [Bacillus paramycoides]|uniref:lectin-like domain-containing protein n=1 Tax=Bacillus paramycoides TaxID=2026194 RepID=UPI003D03448E